VTIGCLIALLGTIGVAGTAGATEPPTDRYALIVGGSFYTGQQEGWYWGATSGMYDILHDDYGIPHDNIYFLFKQGNYSGNWRVDDTTTHANVAAALDELATLMGEDDQLYCYWVDHGYESGGHSYFDLPDTDVSDTWVDARADAIAALHQTWVFTQCNSGGFASVMAQPGRVISTSTRIDETNSAAYAEPFRDGLDYAGGAAPTIADAYENALNSMWADYSTGSRQNQAFKEHCLINDFGTGSGRYGLYLQAGNYVGPSVPSGRSFELHNFIVSAEKQAVGTSTEVRVRFEFYNPTSSAIAFNTVCCGCRDPNWNNKDFGHMNNVTLNAYDSLLFDATTTVNSNGTWHFWPAFNDGSWGPYRWHEITLGVPGWLAARDAYIRRLGSRFDYKAGPYYSSVDPQLELTAFGVYGPVLRDTGFARPNDTITVRFTLKNTGGTTMTFSPYGILVGCRDPQGYNRDFGHQTEVLDPGESVTREATIVVDKPGTWHFWPAYYYNGHWGPYKWQELTLDVYQRTWVENSSGGSFYTVGTTVGTPFGSATVLQAAYGYAVCELTDGTGYTWEGRSLITGGYFSYSSSLAAIRNLIDGNANIAPGIRQWWLDIGLPSIGG